MASTALFCYALLTSLVLSGKCAPPSSSGTIQLAMSRKVVPRPVLSASVPGRYTQVARGNNASSQAIVKTSETVETRLGSISGSHTLQVTIGGQALEVIVDTGSGKTAIVCQGCTQCGIARKHRPFVATNETQYVVCNDTMTTPLKRGEAPCEECDEGKCVYGQSYVEGDHWSAYKVSDTLAFSSTFHARIDFGCIYRQSGVFLAQPSDGIMGFSRHNDAMHEQFYRQHVTRTRIFSQCLAATGGVLTLGGVDFTRHTESVRYTPLRHTAFQYWTVTLLAVSIGPAHNTVQVDEEEFNADRGCVLDSGTTYLYMPLSVQAPFRRAWFHAVGTFANVPVSDTIYHMTPEELAALPDLCFWFANHAHLCVPSSRYLASIGDNVVTGTVFFTPGPRTTILGASVLEGHDIIYDSENHRVGMAEAMCDAPLQPNVALSLDPGGHKFHADVNDSDASLWLLACVTLVALAGLLNAIWVAVARKDQDSDTKRHPDEPCFILMDD